MEKPVDPKILGKIKKCLALSSSDNPHEAAAAMRQAHALMAAHGVSAEQITMDGAAQPLALIGVIFGAF